MQKEQVLTDEEVVRVYAMYYPCKIKENLGGNIYTGIANHLALPLITWHVQVKEKKGMPFIESTKLLLTPLSEISDEHAIEVAKVLGIDRLTDTDMDIPISVIKSKVKSYFENYGLRKLGFENSSNIYQQLIIWRYAVPLFFGLNHWANSKTAIELSIALPSTNKTKP